MYSHRASEHDRLIYNDLAAAQGLTYGDHLIIKGRTYKQPKKRKGKLVSERQLRKMAAALGYRLVKKPNHDDFGLCENPDKYWVIKTDQPTMDEYELEKWLLNERQRQLNPHGLVCTKCGSDKLMLKGSSSYAALSKFDRYQCLRCGSWMREVKRPTRYVPSRTKI